LADVAQGEEAIRVMAINRQRRDSCAEVVLVTGSADEITGHDFLEQ
jgi:hypothetical protein